MARMFYDEGLRFACIRCSKCCRHETGYVFLSERDIQRLVAAAAFAKERFLEAYCRTVPLGGGSFISLKEKENFDCIFWEDDGCSVYEHRPLQCRTYPFWAPYLENRYAWEREKRHCPGIGNGKLYSRGEIEAMVAARRNDPPVS